MSIRQNFETKKNLAFEWFGWDDDTRFQKGYSYKMAPFAVKDLKISLATLQNWKREWIKINAPVTAVDENGDEVYNSDFFLHKNLQYVDGLLLRGCEKLNPNSLKLFFQRAGVLIERSEVKIGLSAEEVARRNLESIRTLREGGFGVDEMQVKPGILPENVCLPAGLSQTIDSEMATMGTSNRTGGGTKTAETDNCI